ncbi:peptidase S16 [Microbacterium caowuchunii]|uniref:LON peptidase substrate-binding domain-containing protein n=1 Tax=Microbacterium caowuchunii TaxID=2614638 RepID=UPI001244370A|nr:LON peptidase substrate-binding domain-containing protein [Microbacterium caowuchunii]QEW00254.1 peptidase S16 [Microbacterium caowuchunii]
MEPVAMFPLGTVLLPAMPLTLRIFEERYRVMLGHLLDLEEPEFGVTLIERGHEAGGGEERFTVGTMARITRITPGAEDIIVVAYGGTRIRVTEWLDDAPYPRAVVSALPSLEWKEELAPLRDEVEHSVRRVLARAAEFSDGTWDPGIDIADDPVTSAWQLAGIAPLGPLDQQALLQSRTTGELLGRTLDLVIEAEPTLTAAAADDDFDQALADLLGEGDDEPDGSGPRP